MSYDHEESIIQNQYPKLKELSLRGNLGGAGIGIAAAPFMGAAIQAAAEEERKKSILGIPFVVDPAMPPGQWGIVQASPAPRRDTFIDAVMSMFSPTNNKPKGNDKMNTKSNIQAQIDRLQDRLAKFARFPESEDFPTGTIIGFDVRFETGPKVYHYAAVKSEKGWHLTGRNTGFWQWSELVSWLAEEVECLALVVVADVEELIEPLEVEDSAYGDTENGEAEK